MPHAQQPPYLSTLGTYVEISRGPVPGSSLHKSELLYGENFNKMMFDPNLFSSFIIRKQTSSEETTYISEVKLKDLISDIKA